MSKSEGNRLARQGPAPDFPLQPGIESTSSDRVWSVDRRPSKEKPCTLKDLLPEVAKAYREYLCILETCPPRTDDRVGIIHTETASKALDRVVAMSDALIASLGNAGFITRRTDEEIAVSGLADKRAHIVEEVFRHFVHKRHRASTFRDDGAAWVSIGFREQFRQITQQIEQWAGGRGEADTPADSKIPRPDPVAVAVALKKDHPGWSDRRIAKAAGCSHSALSRSDFYQRVKARLTEAERTPRRGWKDAETGTIEAIDE